MGDNSLFDVTVVGSGPSGTHAAYPLIKAGLKVAIIDGGLDSKEKDTTDSAPRVGAKSNALDILMKGSLAFNKTYQLLKINSNIEIVQTLAKGGLSEFWHGLCDFLTDEELNEVGLPADSIQNEYGIISKLVNLDTKPRLDIHGRLILEKSPNKVYRLPVTYPYKTSEIIKKFERRKNFTYISGQVVKTVKEKNGAVEIVSVSIKNKDESVVKARYAILATGAINTTRIMLRSKNLFNHKTSFLAKNHSMIVCLHSQTLVKKAEAHIANPGQLGFSSNKTGQKLRAFVQLYRANPVMLSNAAKYIPLPKLFAEKLLSIFIHSLVIADVRFPAFETKNKFCQLKRDGGSDILQISFNLTSNELKKQNKELKQISQTLKTLGLIPLKIISDPVTSHYGGGVPFRGRGRLATDINGKLKNSKHIYIADSAAWRALPGKPLALTIMANASRIGKEVLKKLKK